MGHDQRYKEFLHTFLQDFLKLFYPHVERRLDFGTIEFLDKEVFTDLRDGSRREADVVAKLQSREGKPELVLILVEVQVRTESSVSERMFEYYSLLRSRYKLPIFPIVVYLRRGKKGFAVEEYRDTLFGAEILRFRYESVRLARLNAEEYLDKGLVGAALAALMNRSTRSRGRSLEGLRVSMLGHVVEGTLDEARENLLVDLEPGTGHGGLDVAAGDPVPLVVRARPFVEIDDHRLASRTKILEQLARGGVGILEVMKDVPNEKPGFVVARRGQGAGNRAKS